MRNLFVAVCYFCCILSTLQTSSQTFPPASYPKNYFRDPLDVPISLAANFGELRPNHYHMGLDIRTQKKENLPVYAAADGYIARVVIEPGGFGQAIYINHPNGYTTLYAHLNRFIPALAAYVEEQQYKQQSWRLSLDIPRELFPVRKGQQIAYSGNTGGSQGPHLHFEIRKTEGDLNLNPLLFGLPVPDNTPPTIQRLAVYDRIKSTYEQSPRILPVYKTGTSEQPLHGPVTLPAEGAAQASFSLSPDLIMVQSSHISLAISAFDTQSGSNNPNGIFQAVLYDNDKAFIGFQMDRISYDNTRNLNAHIDYKTRATGGPWLQHLSQLPGYPAPSIYKSFSFSRGNMPGPLPTPPGAPADGVLDLGDGVPHNIRIEVKDAYGNTAVLRSRLKYDASAPAQVTGAAASPAVPDAATSPSASGATGSLSASGATASGAIVSAPAASGHVTTAAGSTMTGPVSGPMGKRFYPGMIDGFETTGCAYYLSEKSLYDSAFIRYAVSPSLPGGVSAIHTIGEPWIPLLDPVLVRIRSDRNGNDATGGSKDRIVMVCSQGSKKDVKRPEWKDGWASASFREFGSFQLIQDNEPPVIQPLGPLQGAHLAKASRIAFRVRDNLGAIRDMRAELDGKWLCFTNDKGLAYIYKFDRHCPPGKHVLRITAEDEAGNKTTASYTFTR